LAIFASPRLCVNQKRGECEVELRLAPAEEETLYFAGAKSEAMNQHMDASLLSDVATILLDCGLRPEECFRLRPESAHLGKVEIQYGKTITPAVGFP
jgi:hypothetical protein